MFLSDKKQVLCPVKDTCALKKRIASFLNFPGSSVYNDK